jgi:mannose-1-phosphate guanylyltransferase
MAGGSGERFWPVSTPARPKQLLDLTGEGVSLLEAALRRLEPVVGAENLWISTSTALSEPIRASGLIAEDRILAEPDRRNTLGAVAWTMASLAAHEGEPFAVAITTSDHAINPTDAFVSTVRKAVETAIEEDALATIGIPPTRPDTGFGYIERVSDGRVRRFTEKPNAETAAQFLAAGDFLWNSGMFFWTEATFARELQQGNPPAFAAYERIKSALCTGDVEAGTAAFLELTSQSIDYALMERASNVRCVPAEFKWDDVGTWDSLLRTVELDAEGNAVVGRARPLETTGSVIYNTTAAKVWTLGVEGLIVVVTDGQILITRADRAQDVRTVAQASQAD